MAGHVTDNLQIRDPGDTSVYTHDKSHTYHVHDNAIEEKRSPVRS